MSVSGPLHQQPLGPLAQDHCMRISCARCLCQDLLSRVLSDHLCKISGCGPFAQDLCVKIFASGSCRTSYARSLYEDPLCRVFVSRSPQQDPVSVCESLLHLSVKISASGSCVNTCARSLCPSGCLRQDPLGPLVQECLQPHHHIVMSERCICFVCHQSQGKDWDGFHANIQTRKHFINRIFLLVQDLSMAFSISLQTGRGGGGGPQALVERTAWPFDRADIQGKITVQVEKNTNLNDPSQKKIEGRGLGHCGGGNLESSAMVNVSGQAGTDFTWPVPKRISWCFREGLLQFSKQFSIKVPMFSR